MRLLPIFDAYGAIRAVDIACQGTRAKIGNPILSASYMQAVRFEDLQLHHQP